MPSSTASRDMAFFEHILKNIFKGNDDYKRLHQMQRWRENAHEYIELCESVIKVLKTATGQNNLILGTLLSYPGIFTLNGSLKEKPQFCPQCIDNDLENKSIPHERLLWRLSSVSCCPKHQCKLINIECGAFPQPRGKDSTNPLDIPGICACGSIGYRCNPEISRANISKPTPNDLLIANLYADLLNSGKDFSNTPLTKIKNALLTFAKTQTDGIAGMARRSGNSKTTLWHFLMDAEQKTTLQRLESIALSEGLTLEGIFSGELVLTGIQSSTSFQKKKRTPVDKANILKALEQALLAEPTPNLAEFSRQIGFHRKTVRVLFPERSRELVEKSQTQRQAQSDSNYMKAVAYAEDTLRKMLVNNIKPTLRNARYLDGQQWFPNDWSSLALAELRSWAGLGTMRSKRLESCPRALCEQIAKSKTRLTSDPAFMLRVSALRARA